MDKTIVIIGAGNVATHLSMALKNAGYPILQVFSRKIDNAFTLASLVEAKAIDKLSDIEREADLYIIAVSDVAIGQVVEAMPEVKGVVAHTAGSVDMDVLNRFVRYGVIYPFQTLTKEKELDFRKVPLLIEENGSVARRILLELANAISDHVQKANSAKRKTLHIGAVFSSNFVNHLYAIAYELLKKEGLDFSLLEPLIKETTQKALTMSPIDAQTGPARRGDRAVMERHKELLNSNSFYHEIYSILSESISKMYAD